MATSTEGVRENFTGMVTYAAGMWEGVDWNMYDIIGLDYYRDTQTEDEYLAGLKPYRQYGKPIFVMEVGCCAFSGASKLGGGAFGVCLGSTPDGKEGIYLNDMKPMRSEKEQANYVAEQIRVLKMSGINGMFIFEFAFPIAPYREDGFDADMTAYPIVKSFPAEDPRSQQIPAWEPKKAFYEVARGYK